MMHLSINGACICKILIFMKHTSCPNSLRIATSQGENGRTAHLFVVITIRTGEPGQHVLLFQASIHCISKSFFSALSEAMIISVTFLNLVSNFLDMHYI